MTSIWSLIISTTLPVDRIKRVMRLGSKFYPHIEFHWNMDDLGLISGILICENFERLNAVATAIPKILRIYNNEQKRNDLIFRASYAIDDLVESVIVTDNENVGKMITYELLTHEYHNTHVEKNNE